MKNKKEHIMENAFIWVFKDRSGGYSVTDEHFTEEFIGREGQFHNELGQSRWVMPIEDSKLKISIPLEAIEKEFVKIPCEECDGFLYETEILDAFKQPYFSCTECGLVFNYKLKQ